MDKIILKSSERAVAFKIYLVLGTLFITSLVVSNLIFQKFFYWDFFGMYTFEISVGILPYPITFLITDIISEIYGQEKASQVVVTGIFASLFSLLILFFSSIVPATPWSPVDDLTFDNVFGASSIAVFASMMSYLLAQFVDIKIFHFWKRLTKGKHLWIRNNFSTFFSQFVDTCTILLLLCLTDIIPWSRFETLLINGFLFKVFVAVIDTPFLYIVIHYLRKKFNIQKEAELSMEI